MEEVFDKHDMGFMNDEWFTKLQKFRREVKVSKQDTQLETVIAIPSGDKVTLKECLLKYCR